MANHEIVYGICENKCQHEVYRKEVADDKFLSKSDAGNLYARKSHATSETTYGVATNNVYGHVKLTTNLRLSENNSEGIALQASVGKVLSDGITSAVSQLWKIPVGGIFVASQNLDDGAVVATMIGYGTWELFHTLDLGSYDKNIYFYVRTS